MRNKSPLNRYVLNFGININFFTCDKSKRCTMPKTRPPNKTTAPGETSKTNTHKIPQLVVPTLDNDTVFDEWFTDIKRWLRLTDYIPDEKKADVICLHLKGKARKAAHTLGDDVLILKIHIDEVIPIFLMKILRKTWKTNKTPCE